MATTLKEKCLRLSLPETVKRVPSHLSWMEELSGHLLEERPLDKVTSLKEYLQPIVEMRNKLLQSGIEEEGHHLMIDEDEMELAKYLNWAAMNVYLGEVTFAEENLKVLDQLEDNPWELTSGKLEVFQYCRDVLRWAMEHNKMDDSVADKLLLRWDAINKSNEGQAVVCFLKAKVSLILGISEESALQFYMEAIELEPGCALWYQRAYRSIRKIRLASDTFSTPPSEDEEYYAWAAFEMAPNNIVMRTSYAVMLRDKIWNEGWEYWEAHEEEYLEVLHLLTTALEMAKEKESKKWVRFASGYLGEILCVGKSSKLDRWLGLHVLEECAQDNPNSWILHKLARVYHYGFRGCDMPHVIDVTLAEETYLRALDAQTTNFPCLLDYLKLLNRLRRFVDMMEQLDKVLEAITEPIWVARLRGLRAFLIWANNPNHTNDHKNVAVRELLTVFEEIPNYRQEMLNHHPFFEFGNDCVKAEIVRYCREICSRKSDGRRAELLADEISQHFPQQESSGGDVRECEWRMGGLQLEMQNLSMATSTESSRSGWRSNEETRGGRTARRQQERSQDNGVGRSFSTADKDTDWRK